MRIASRLLLIAITIFFPSGAAFAQGEGGHSPGATIRITHRYSECVVRRHRTLVVRMLEQIPNSPDERRAAAVLGSRSGNCLVAAMPNRSGGLMRFQSYSIRGQLAEALFKRDFTAVGVARTNPARSVQLPDLVEASRHLPIGDLTRASLVLGSFAMCVVRTQPEKAFRLLQSDPASTDETAAMGELMPDFGPCFPDGQQFQINPPMLRGFIAEGLYRYSAQLAARNESN